MNLVLPIFWIIIIEVFFLNRIVVVKFERTLRKYFFFSFKNVLDFFFKLSCGGRNCYFGLLNNYFEK